MADLVVFENIIPFALMRHENRGIFLFLNFLFVITCSHHACSQDVNSFKSKNKPFVIDNVTAYTSSIKGNTDKRIVLLKLFVNELVTDFKYATKENFTRQILYEKPVAFVRLPVAVALQKVQDCLAEKGLGLKLFDAYRPYSISLRMWKIVHDCRFTANPANGSAHNRGAAVDVTLVDLVTKQELRMPTNFDDFTEKANHRYTRLNKEVLQNRTTLKDTMEKYGFKSLSTEWWHYSLPLAEKFELLNLSFHDLEKLSENNITTADDFVK